MKTAPPLQAAVDSVAEGARGSVLVTRALVGGAKARVGMSAGSSSHLVGAVAKFQFQGLEPAPVKERIALGGVCASPKLKVLMKRTDF